MKNSCVFCGVINGDVPAPIVFADEFSVAFLDHRPLFPGHCLLVPRSHYETLADLPRAQIGELFTNAQLLAKAVEIAMEAEGTFVAMNNRVSQSVPHLHVHIVPRRRGDGLKGFFWPRNKYQDEEHAKKTETAIKKAVSELT
ncbi:MAG TPA: HIT family protein [Pyrinomonadaceae bacterium]|nr:HIT family protein [Pyrinomonadaceae bacterium]